MPRVLQIINRLNIGGPTSVTVALTHHLAPEFETLLVAGMKDDTEGDSSYIAHAHGIEPIYIPDMHRELNPILDYRAYREISTVIRRFKPDIVHTHAAKAGALGRLAAVHAGVSVVVHTFHGHIFHSYFSPIKTRFYLEIERYLASKSSGIIVLSELQKRELSSEFKIAPLEKLHIITNGFDLTPFRERQEEKRARFRNRYGLKEDEIAVGIIGRLVPVKNHKMFLEVMASAMKSSAIKIKGFIIGDGELRDQIETQVRQMGFVNDSTQLQNSQIIFTSWIKNIDEAYAGLDIIMLNSFNEGAPSSLIEAQASARVVLATRVGGVGDVVLEGKTGFLFQLDDAEGMALRLCQLAYDSNLRNRMGFNGRAFAEDNFDITRLIEQTGVYYNQLLKQSLIK